MASGKRLRLYADTSVFGGVFDPEFAVPSRAFFQQVRQSEFTLVVSDVVRRELAPAPEPIRALLDAHLADAEVVPVTASALALRQAYIDARILTPNWLDDALHVALATVAGCDAIISWNFKHIVHFQKIPLYNAVNTLHGHSHLFICSPQEIISYADEDTAED